MSYKDKDDVVHVGVSKKIIIGGAGMAGLCCAYELMKKGHDVTVLEASGRHGGHVMTAHDGLSDGLYADFGQEHFTQGGYVNYWGYTREFNLAVQPYPRRDNILRRMDGKWYTELMLADPAVLKSFGLNEREIKFLVRRPWWEFSLLFTEKYLDKFSDEFQPFGIGFDEFDKIPMSDIFKKEGASPGALKILGGGGVSALFGLWTAAVYRLRNISTFEKKIFRLKGGNQMLPNAFAKRLGQRVWLNSPIKSVSHSDSEVAVKYKRFNEELEMKADYYVNCIPLPAFRNIPVYPAMPPEKQFIFDNLTYSSYQRFVFQASSKFWLNDGIGTVNLYVGSPDLWNVWESTNEVDTNRVIILATGPGGISPQRALAAFREVYPGKNDTIEQAISKDWTKEAYASTCERESFPIGQLHKFWPHVMEPHGRIYFAGAYADNLSRGTEAATRSANRVADAIHSAS
ncbi:MAG: NAD(P)/FAD-dependent oxidoreductase [Flavitalea sp.]